MRDATTGAAGTCPMHELGARFDPFDGEPTRIYPLFAEARRAATKADASTKAEIGGRGGLDPARYGDWEVKGVASDF